MARSSVALSMITLKKLFKDQIRALTQIQTRLFIDGTRETPESARIPRRRAVSGTNLAKEDMADELVHLPFVVKQLQLSTISQYMTGVGEVDVLNTTCSVSACWSELNRKRSC